MTDYERWERPNLVMVYIMQLCSLEFVAYNLFRIKISGNVNVSGNKPRNTTVRTTINKQI